MSRSILLNSDGNAVFNAGFDLDELIDNLPAGLDRAMLRILEFHKGRENAISRGQLVLDLTKHGFEVHEREARAMINQLRKHGIEICSTGGERGGYWLATSQEEIQDFTHKELRPRALDLLEQAEAMEKAAEKRWGRYSPSKQAVMFLE